MSYRDENQAALGGSLSRPTFRGVLRVASAAIGLAVVGLACGAGASPPPIPTAVVPPVPTVAPAATAAPSTVVAPAQAPASVFQFPPTRTPLPTPTPFPRAEGDMAQGVLYNHTATLLEDGRVLVAGGQTTRRGSQFSLPPGVASAEIYDPSTGRWSPTSPMFDARRHHGAVLLEDGRVLVAGGLTDEFGTNPEGAWIDWVGSIGSAEVYDPTTETWSLVGDMPEQTVSLIGTQSMRPAILLEMLDNGKVLAIGGLGPSAGGLYDPSSGTWASDGEPATSSKYQKRLEHRSVLLGNGKVLFIGGWDGRAQRGSMMDSVELYDPLTGSASPTGSLSGPRLLPSVAVLADGRVLAAGGLGGISFRSVATSEIYDPQSGTWSGAEEMTTKRILHTMTVLPDGRVLVVGDGPNRWTEMYDPSTGIWSRVASTIAGRLGHTATVLKDGRVLVAGGTSPERGQPFPSTSAEVYDPVADIWTPSTEAAR